MGVSSLLDTNATVRHLGADQLPLTIRHAECAGSLTWEHRDPFDRMLVAQAACEDLTLVSADRQVLRAPAVRTLAW